MSHNISQAARSWVGTAFAHQGRRKASAGDKGRVDCLGLLVGVAEECGVRFGGRSAAQLDETDYGHYPDEQRLLRTLSQHMQPVELAQMGEGDVALMRIDGRNQHLGIIGERAGALTLIHAYAPARKVVEHGLTEAWRAKMVKIFRLSLN